LITAARFQAPSGAKVSKPNNAARKLQGSGWDAGYFDQRAHRRSQPFLTSQLFTAVNPDQKNCMLEIAQAGDPHMHVEANSSKARW